MFSWNIFFSTRTVEKKILVEKNLGPPVLGTPPSYLSSWENQVY